MGLYLDSAYIAKCYLQEPDAGRVRALVQEETELCSSAWAVVELACIFHRNVREGRLRKQDAHALQGRFRAHLDEGLWTLVPLSEGLLRQVETAMRELAGHVFLRAGDVIHLVSAGSAGFAEIWTSDRHLLKAAAHFGLRGRSV